MGQPYYDEGGVTIYHGDALAILQAMPDETVQCCVTSPPYFGLRDYGVEGQLGLEPTPEAYVSKLVAVFREVRRVLKQDGTLWLNLGDSYAGSGKGGQSEEKRSKYWMPEYGNKGAVYGLKPKDLIGIPWMVAFALRADGWYLRSDIIWAKPNPMPESVQDRPTKAHEYLFLLSKREKYYYDAEAINEPYSRLWDEDNMGANNKWVTGEKEGKVLGRKTKPNCGLGNSLPGTGRNKRSVWTIATQPYPEAHFATFPPKLIEPCIMAGSRAGDVVLDPFLGSGTSAFVAKQLNRRAIGIELNDQYLSLATNRLRQEVLAL